ncbi:unnamed protein product [Rotaria sp. Silwood2]|nr:unnamed protein product [Rotaria sp. Silwood2]CAF2959536.1 unnamed protein product [Rotaria sp. Silwood2]CAF3906284.1 unnamed protein product [Rotaria sp. Silwood2]CAF3990619.1 unnamed protein product [Rotaria sp. Silwood2]CAF4186075.1 unnamed protein product [Rotaria sp. Silwood2]
MKNIKISILILVISIIVYLFIEHINRRAYELLNEIEYRGSRSIDEIEKRTRQLINATIFEFNNQITQQINSVVEKNRKYIPLQNPYGATTCTEWFGCHKGYCWAGCAGAFPSLTGPEWCYTTKSKGKMTCSQDQDCNGCWRCSSPCSI